MTRLDKFLATLQRKKGSDFSSVGSFSTQRTRTTFKHNVCGHVWETLPVTLLNAKGDLGCPKCQYRKKATTPEDFQSKVAQIHSGEYIVNNWQEYENNTKKLSFTHVECGTVFMLRPSSIFINKISCPECSKKVPSPNCKTTDEFSRELSETHKGEYQLVAGSEYTTALDKVTVTHTICGHIWDVRASHILHTSGCPRCNLSKGESYVESILLGAGITFTREYTFDDCRNVKTLPFDFAISNAGLLVGLIEYDGEQHFKAIPHFGGQDKLTRTIANDNTKNQYCKDMNIPLLRVKYTNSLEQVERLVLDFASKIITS